MKRIPFDYERWKNGDSAFVSETDGTTTEYFFRVAYSDEILYEYNTVGLMIMHRMANTWYGKQSFIETMQLNDAHHNVAETASYSSGKSIQQLLDEALARVL